MSYTFKELLKSMGLGKPVRWAQRKIWENRIRGKNAADIFTEIYHTNKWGNSESISGNGSSLAATQGLREALPELLRALSIETLIDMPCGDFHWFKELGYELKHYYGYDIVPDLIEKNQALYGNEQRIFRIKNCLVDPFDAADILFCRDLIIHFSYEDIWRLLENYANSDIPYLLISHNIGVTNRDIHTGGWRAVNLTLEPFSLPEPRKVIIDQFLEPERDAGTIKAMALWEREDIAQVIAARHNLLKSGTGG